MPLSDKEVLYVCVFVSALVPVSLAIILHVINCCIRLFAAAADAPDPTADGDAADSVAVDVVGLQRKLIEIRGLKLQETIPLDIVKENDSSRGKGSSDCAICLEEFEAGEEVRVLPRCGHRYHGACIDEWLLDYNSKQCPTCRAIVCR